MTCGNSLSSHDPGRYKPIYGSKGGRRDPFTCWVKREKMGASSNDPEKKV